MKIKMAIWFFAVTTSWGPVTAQTDPIREYLATALSRNGYLTRYYSDDRILSTELFLTGSSDPEILISLGRAVSGREGNVWLAFRKSGDGYKEIGEVTFSLNRFYFGPVDEVAGNGIVTFWPGGGGEGILIAYVWNGTTLEQKEIGRCVRDPVSGRIIGSDRVEKYLREKSTYGPDVTKTLSAREFAQKYGTRVEPITYLESLQQTPTPAANVRTESNMSASKATSSDTHVAAVVKTQSAETLEPSSVASRWLLWVAAAVCVVLGASLVWMKYRMR